MMVKIKGLCKIHKAALAIIVIGALNWGLVGLFQFDLVMNVLGNIPLLMRYTYVLVGLSGVIMLINGKCCDKSCKCSDDACAHCADEKKPVMGGGQKM